MELLLLKLLFAFKVGSPLPNILMLALFFKVQLTLLTKCFALLCLILCYTWLMRLLVGHLIYQYYHICIFETKDVVTPSHTQV